MSSVIFPAKYSFVISFGLISNIPVKFDVDVNVYSLTLCCDGIAVELSLAKSNSFKKFTLPDTVLLRNIGIVSVLISNCPIDCNV